MKLTVTDANIFIDLIKLQLIGFLFNIELEIHTSQEIVDQLTTEQSETLQGFADAGVLHVTLFTVNEIQAITEMQTPKALEFADKTVLFLANKISAAVLTGDGALRKYCEGKQLTVKGIIWLFDEFYERGLISKDVAAEKMEALIGFNDRLPKGECVDRIEKWKK